MYRTINFETNVFDKNGHSYYRPIAYCVGSAVENKTGDDYKLFVNFKFTHVEVFSIPILKQGTCFSGEKLGKSFLIAKLFSDIETNKILLYKCYDENNFYTELPIPEVLFSYIRPEDSVEIELTKNDDSNISSIKYSALKSNIQNLGRIEVVQYAGEHRFVDKKYFTETIVPKSITKKRKVKKWSKKH